MQIANQFRTDILAGKYAQGEYLPSILYLEPECFWKSDCIFYPKGIHSSTGGYCGRYCTGSDRRVIQYGLMKLFYKFQLSKAAFGAAAKRGMNA